MLFYFPVMSSMQQQQPSPQSSQQQSPINQQQSSPQQTISPQQQMYQATQQQQKKLQQQQQQQQTQVAKQQQQQMTQQTNQQLQQDRLMQQVHAVRNKIIFIALDKALFFHQKVSIFVLFLDKSICCGYSSEAPRWGTSNEYPQHMFSSSNKKTVNLIPTLI